MRKLFALIVLVLFVFTLFSCDNIDLDGSRKDNYDFSEYVTIKSNVITYDGENHELTPEIIKELPEGYKIKAVTNTEFSEIGEHEVVYKVVNKDNEVFYILNATLTIEESKVVPTNEELGLKYKVNLSGTDAYVWTYNECLLVSMASGKSYSTYKLDGNSLVHIIVTLADEFKPKETANLASEELDSKSDQEKLADVYELVSKLMALIEKLKNIDYSQYIENATVNKEKFYDDMKQCFESLFNADMLAKYKEKFDKIVNMLKEDYDLDIKLTDDEDKKLEHIIIKNEEKTYLDLEFNYENGTNCSLSINDENQYSLNYAISNDNLYEASFSITGEKVDISVSAKYAKDDIEFKYSNDDKYIELKYNEEEQYIDINQEKISIKVEKIDTIDESVLNTYANSMKGENLLSVLLPIIRVLK